MQRRMLSLYGLMLCFAATLVSAKAQNQALQPEQPVYEIYAISYGLIPDFPVSSLVADKSRKLDIQMMIWLLKGPGGRNVLVDAGFYRDKFLQR